MQTAPQSPLPQLQHPPPADVAGLRRQQTQQHVQQQLLPQQQHLAALLRPDRPLLQLSQQLHLLAGLCMLL
jgi:hypothetical protein